MICATIQLSAFTQKQIVTEDQFHLSEQVFSTACVQISAMQMNETVTNVSETNKYVLFVIQINVLVFIKVEYLCKTHRDTYIRIEIDTYIHPVQQKYFLCGLLINCTGHLPQHAYTNTTRQRHNTVGRLDEKFLESESCLLKYMLHRLRIKYLVTTT